VKVTLAELRGGTARAVGKALSTVEEGGEPAEELLRTLLGQLGGAHTIGITGSPGVGKSTLAQALGLQLLA
jgi:LAO/AO transport system kinase